MRTDCPRLVIAAPASGCGKSTIATGLMAALADEHVVQGFKVGPDYIDPMYHTVATGRPSRNLDTWMVPRAGVLASFVRAMQGAGVAIIEGVMGLFDGYQATGESGSTAEVAKLLDAPVVLVLDVARMARSAGALALGYRDYDPALDVVGVICNRVASTTHARWVTEAIEAIGLPVLGCVPRHEALSIPERHLGLHTAVERTAEALAFVQAAATLVREHVDLARLWAMASNRRVLRVEAAPVVERAETLVRVAVARDEAFCFYYEDNLDLLRDAGAEIVFFSPLRDGAPPADASGLYLGGGYPEIYAAQLADNVAMRECVRVAHAQRMPIYAECGGLMVLTQSLTDLQGETFAMWGLLPGRSHMRERLTMGYREVTALCDSLLFRKGDGTRGHEFHYSDWLDRHPELAHAYAIAPRADEPPRHEGVACGNLLASYVHLHFGADEALAVRLVSACRRWADGSR